MELKLTNNLCILEWFKFPFSSLPSDFRPQNLVKLKLPSSSIKWLQFGCEGFRNLLELDMSWLKNLIETPSFEGVPNLEILNLSCCDNLSQIDPSIKLLKWLQILRLQYCIGLGRSSTSIGDWLSSLSSLEKLSLFGCHLRDEAFPSSVRGLSLLKSLGLCLNKFTRIPDGIWQSFNLEELLLGNDTGLYAREFDFYEHTPFYSSKLPLTSLRCLKKLDIRGYNLLDKAIFDDISCLSSLYFLDLSESNFRRLPSSLYRLPILRELILYGLGSLEVLRKLLVSLEYLCLKQCPSLDICYIPTNTWNSNVISHAIHCSVMIGYIGYDGQPYEILLLHPQCPLWTRERDEPDLENEAIVFCGPVLELGIPKWFNKRSTNFAGTFRCPIDDELESLTVALFIVYQVHDNPTFPIFVCEFKAEGYHESVPVIFCAPELPFVGLNRVWVVMNLTQQLKTFNKGGNLQPSIVTRSLNVEVNEFWAHLTREHNLLEFFDAQSGIYAGRVESLEKLFSDWKVSASLAL